jgi:hypothetical protein
MTATAKATMTPSIEARVQEASADLAQVIGGHTGEGGIVGDLCRAAFLVENFVEDAAVDGIGVALARRAFDLLLPATIHCLQVIGEVEGETIKLLSALREYLDLHGWQFENGEWTRHPGRAG